MSLGLVFACSYIKNPWAFIYCYGFAIGIGKACFYSSALQAGWSHLQHRIGMVSGLIICGFGFGGFTFGIVTNRLCNPDNLTVQKFMIDGEEEHLFPEEVAKRVPEMIRTLDIIWLCLFFFSACTVHTYKPPVCLLDLNSHPSSVSLNNDKEDLREGLLDNTQRAQMNE